MIQARKIQYMCMSKLSPQELASRAHQFLADGDKKKQHSSSKTLSSTQEGEVYICGRICTYYHAMLTTPLHGLNRNNGFHAINMYSEVVKLVYVLFVLFK